MKRLFASIICLFVLTSYAGAGEIVRLPLASNLTDVKGGLTDGKLYRDSAATYVNTSGVLTTAHGSRENLVDASGVNDITAWWTLLRAGNSTAGAIIPDTNTNTHGFYKNTITGVTSAGTYVLSAKIKAGSQPRVEFLINAQDAGLSTVLGSYSVYFDVTNGTDLATVVTTGGVTGVYGTDSIDSDGYFRCYATVTIPEITGLGNVRIFIFSATSASSHTFAGDDSTISTYIKELQLEALPSGNVIGSDLFDQETLGSELITAQNNRDFSSGTIGNWNVNKDGTGTLAYNTDAIGGADNKQALLTSTGDIYLGATISNSFVSFATNTLHRIEVKVYVPSANTNKNMLLQVQNMTGAIPTNSGQQAIPADTWTTIVWYTYLAADATGTLWIGCSSNPADGDKFYFDDISVKEVTAPAKGIPYDANTTGQAWPGLAGSELVTNGTMEADANWSNLNTPTTNEQSTTQKNSGTYSRKFVTDASWDGISSDTFSMAANTLYKVNFWVYPDDSTNIYISIKGGGGASLYSNQYTGLSQDSWNEIPLYLFNATAGSSAQFEVTGNIGGVGTWYLDDVSIRPVQVSWIPYGTNTVEIDETEEAVKVTYVDNSAGMYIQLGDLYDLSASLPSGEWFQLEYEVATDDANARMFVDLAVDVVALTPAVADTFESQTLIFQSTGGSPIFRVENLSAGTYFSIRNLSIKAIPPLALLEPSEFATGTIPAQPRFESAGLLVEGEAVNLLDYSEDFGEWTASDVTPVANLTGPDGGSNSAYTLTATDNNGTLKYTAVPVLAGTADTFSIWMKRVTGTGAVNITEDDGSTWTEKTLTTSWQRFSVSGTETNPVVGVQIEVDTDAIGIFGADLKEEAFLTSYIPTDGSSAWRTTEAADATNGTGYQWTMGTAVMNAIKDGVIAGSLFAEFTPGSTLADDGATYNYSILTAGTGYQNLLYIQHDSDWSGVETQFKSSDSTTSPASGSIYPMGANDTYIAAVRWSDALDDFNVSYKLNGSWTINSGGALDADGYYEVGTFRLGYGNEFPIHIKNISMLDLYLPDNNLEAGRASFNTEIDIGAYQGIYKSLLPTLDIPATKWGQ